MAHKRITAAINAATRSGRPALVPFITAGYPDPDIFIDTLKAVAEVGDVVELGIPFSDPIADGMTIQRSSFEALRKGVSLKWIFDQLDTASGEIDAPLVMMSYLNPLLAFGYDALAERALAAGVCGFIVPDLPFEESDDIRAALEIRDLGLIQLVTPATPDERLQTLCKASRGFVYAVTITGITGGGAGLPDDLAHYLYAKWSWIWPAYLLDEWGRPGCTALYFLPAWLGWPACRLLAAALSAGSAWLAYLIARQLGVRNPWGVIILCYAQPLFFQLAQTTLTETPLMFYWTAAVFLLGPFGLVWMRLVLGREAIERIGGARRAVDLEASPATADPWPEPLPTGTEVHA